MSDALSGYDITYHGMDDKTREAMASDVDKILANSLATVNLELARGIAKAVADATAELVANPWSEWIRENASSYKFAEAFANSIFAGLKSTSPNEVSRYKIDDLFSAWRKQFPDDVKAIADAAIFAENEKLRTEIQSLRQSITDRH